MSKLCSNDKKQHHENASDNINADLQYNEQPDSSTVCVGASNIKLWTELRTACKYNCDVKFTTFLLNLAQKHIK